jgi:MFS transporter, DHA1 family, putative efflux transporter
MSARWRLAVAWISLFVIGTDLFVISPLLPLIAAEYGISGPGAGLSVTVFAVAYMVSAPLLGMVADRTGRRAALLVALFAFAAANVLTAAAPDFVCLLISRVAAGIAAAGVTPLIYAEIGEAAPAARRATWMAIAVSGLLLSLSLGAPAGALLADTCGWRVPILGLAALSLLLVGANRLAWPEGKSSPSRGPAVAPAPGSATLIARLAPTVLWATALYGMYTYLGVGLAAAGFASGDIARAISLYGIAALAGTLIGGQAADRFGAERTILASLFGLAAGLAALGFSLRDSLTAEIVLVLLSVSAQLFFPAQQARLAGEFPDRRATVLAWNNSALFLGISLGSLIGGQAVAHTGFAGSTTALAAIAGAAGLFTAWLAGRPFGRVAMRVRAGEAAPLARLTAP